MEFSRKIEDLALAVGRAKRKHPDDPTVSEIASLVESIDAATFPNAAELFASFHDTEDEDDAISRALGITDQRSERIRRLLGIRDPLQNAA